MAVSVYRWFVVCSLWLVVVNPRLEKSFNLQISQKEELHPYYISVVEINHNASDKTLEISCKIFTNDFESTLEKNYKSKVDLSNPKDKTSTDKWINNYIKKHLSIKADNREVNFSYLGFEKEDEAIYSYFQVDNVTSVKKIDVTNSILHDFSDQQINIIHCMVGGKRQSTKLDYPKTEASFSF
jgi:hypothetical protein